MEENNNFFGFVSKIGSLINNKSKDAKKANKGREKRYNIKISTDDEINIDNIDNQDDEEEEEEEEDEKEEQKVEEKKENKEEENKIKEESEKEKEKIKNIVEDIMKNNDKEKNNEEEDNKEEENNINNIENENNIDNINNINNDNSDINNYNRIECPPILNNSFPVLNNSNGKNLPTFIYNDTTSCHIMLKKGNDININDYRIIPILFMEKQKNIFYKIGVMDKPISEPKKYLFFFDEHYLYFVKDEIIEEEMDEETRRITKIVSLFDIKDFSTDNDNDKFIIKLFVKKEDSIPKIVTFYIEPQYFSGFIKNFNLKLSIYGIDFFSQKNKS